MASVEVYGTMPISVPFSVYALSRWCCSRASVTLSLTSSVMPSLGSLLLSDFSAFVGFLDQRHDVFAVLIYVVLPYVELVLVPV